MFGVRRTQACYPMLWSWLGRDGMSAQVRPDLTFTVEYNAKLKRYSV
jgi:hypothetical protein